MLRKILIALLLTVGVGIASAQDGGDPQALPPDADVGLNELVYTADFSSEANWANGSFEDGALRWEPVADGLAVISPDAEGPARFVPGTAFTALNFYVEMTFTPRECLDGESAMLFNVRSDPDSDDATLATAYVFVIECNGTYRSRPVNNGVSGLVDFSGNLPEALSAGEAVTLGVVVNGREIAWYVDGELLGTYIGSTNPVPGQFAVGAQLGLDALVTRLQVWSLEGEVAVSEELPQDIDNPLDSSSVGRNIFVESFFDPSTPLITGWDDLAPGYRIRDQVVVSSGQAVLARYLTDTPDPSSYRVYAVRVNFQLRQCTGDGAFGLALGGDGESFTGLMIACDGTFTANEFINGELTETYLTQPVEAPEPFSFGREISAVVSGETVFAYYEGDILGSFEAAGVNEGRIGLAWIADEGEITEFGIDNYDIVELLPQ